MSGHIYRVLFLCTGNSARSIMAEAILNGLGGSRFKAHSAGSRPRGRVHPYALELLENVNLDSSFARSKSWEAFVGPDAPVMDFVFTVCDAAAHENCPTWPGKTLTAQWGIPDPAAVEGTVAEMRFAFADVYRMLSNRISIFMALPVSSLDRMTLRSRLREIGRDIPRAG